MDPNAATSSKPAARHGAHGLLAAIGDTPLIEIELVHQVAADTRLFAKLESMNPGGSIKDRLAARGRSHTIVTVLSDGGDRYGTTGMWEM